MLIRVVLCALAWLTIVTASLGQSKDADSQTLKEILVEIRALHQDMRITETTQLLVAELEMQQSVVNRATENVDNARAKLNDIHRDQKQLAADLAHAEEQLDKAANSDERNAISQDIERHTSNIAALKVAEHDSNATLQEFEQRQQSAQDKLASIEDELNAVISRLGPASKDSGQK